ncbi:hypothetical protein HDV02_004162 [Globomyces sp. JEL0801]|nr:hypothetical protein HDV02_004162 [Globomyces sp. JEL0801]
MSLRIALAYLVDQVLNAYPFRKALTVYSNVTHFVHHPWIVILEVSQKLALLETVYQSLLDIIKVSPLRFKLIVDADEDKQGLFGVFRQSTVNLQLDSPISSVMYGVICNHREILVDILRSSPTFREDHKTKIKLEKRHLRELYLAQRSSIPPPQNIDNSKISEGQQQEKNSQSAQKLQESSNQTQSPTNSNNNPSISAANNDVWNSSRIMNTLKPLIGDVKVNFQQTTSITDMDILLFKSISNQQCFKTIVETKEGKQRKIASVKNVPKFSPSQFNSSNITELIIWVFYAKYKKYKNVCITHVDGDKQIFSFPSNHFPIDIVDHSKYANPFDMVDLQWKEQLQEKVTILDQCQFLDESMTFYFRTGRQIEFVF